MPLVLELHWRRGMQAQASYFSRNLPWILVAMTGCLLLAISSISRISGNPLDHQLDAALFYSALALIVLSLVVRTVKNRVLA